MARPVPVQFDGAVYHVTARGNERKDIYRHVADRERFLETLGETGEPNSPFTAGSAICVGTRCSTVSSFPPFSFLSPRHEP